MKMNRGKRLAAAMMALCLFAGNSLSAFATEGSLLADILNAEVLDEQEPTETSDTNVQDDSTVTKALDAEIVGTVEELAGKPDAQPAGDKPDTSDTSEDDVTNEAPNTDIKVESSDKNALILRDAGEESPRGVPGQEVDMIFTLEVNREYLPSEKYVLRNITIRLDIPTESTSEKWPFDIMDASSTKHLNDMSYNSIADVWYTLRISEFAKKGVYKIGCIVNATIWREDSVNGTTITEDVEFPLNAFLTVVEDGDMSGVTSDIGPLEIAGRHDTAVACATGSPGSSVVLSVPIKNKGKSLTNVTVAPVVTGDLETFPFVASDINYGRELGSMENGDEQTVDWPMTISPYATTGNKVVTIRATYEENGVYGECTLEAYIYVVNGYVEESAPSLMVAGYGIYPVGSTGTEAVSTAGEKTDSTAESAEEEAETDSDEESEIDTDENELEYIEAGTDAVLRVTLKNNAAYDTIYKTVAVLSLADSSALVLSQGSSDSAYVRSIAPGATAEIEYHITARASAPVGPSAAAISLSYENQNVVKGESNANIQIPIRQLMNLQLDTPVVYGTPTQGEPLAISLNMTNLGRSRVYNVSVAAMNGISLENPYYGGDILAAGSLNADLQIIPNKSGTYTGTLVVQYEDAEGEQYMENVSLDLTVDQPVDEDMLSAMAEVQPEEKSDGVAWWVIVLVLLLLAIAGLSAWLIYNRRRQRQDEPGTQDTAQDESEGRWRL